MYYKTLDLCALSERSRSLPVENDVLSLHSPSVPRSSSFVAILLLAAPACGSHNPSNAPGAPGSQSADAIQQQLIATLEASQAQISMLARSLDAGKADSQTAKLVTIARQLDSLDVAARCLQIMGPNDMTRGYCSERRSCGKHFGAEVSAQWLDILSVLARYPDKDAAAYASEVALDASEGPQRRLAALEVLEAIGSRAWLPAYDQARSAAHDTHEFGVRNAEALAKLSQRLQACQHGGERDVTLSVRLPAGQSHAVVDGPDLHDALTT